MINGSFMDSQLNCLIKYFMQLKRELKLKDLIVEKLKLQVHLTV